MHPSPVYTGGASRRTTAWVVAGTLAAAALAAAGWAAWRGAGPPDAPATARRGSTPAAATAAHTPFAAASATPPTGPGAPPVAAILASATAAAVPTTPDDPLAGLRALEAAGYVEAARDAYRAALRGSADDAVALAAGIALARLALADGDAPGALAALASAAGVPAAPGGLDPTAAPGATVSAPAAPDAAPDAAADAPTPPPAAGVLPAHDRVLGALDAAPAGLYLYARALEDVGHRAEAAQAYARYGVAVPELADAAAMAEGNIHFALGDHAAALDAFARAGAAATDANTVYWSTLRRGNALLRLGPPEAAVAAYLDAHARAQDDAQRAQALAGLIAAHDAAGRPADMLATRRRLVRELPGTALAAAALGKLKAAGETVPPAEEAAVLAGNGDVWGAITRLSEAARATPGAPAAWSVDLARWYAEAGEPARAVEAADAVLGRPDAADDALRDAGWIKARALARRGDDAGASAAYAWLADRFPADARAAEALWQRAWLVAHAEGARAGADAFEAVAARFPASDFAAEARFRSGLMAWRAGDLPRAAERWSAGMDHGDGADRARAAYWLGKAAFDTGAAAEAAPYWRLAAEADPTGYYGLRAAERLAEAGAVPGDLPTRTGAAGDVPPAGPPPDSPGPVPAGATPPDGFDRAVPAWLARWRPGTTADAWARAGAAAAARAEVRRGRAWLAVGEVRAAQRAWRAANADAWGDPLAQAWLARLAAAEGMHDVASSAAAAVIAQAPPELRLAAPVALARLAYPDAFGDLVRAEAAAHGVPVDLFFALIRQESRFDPLARSGAGATGLTQVMPATGEGIAGMLGDADFETAHLYRPYFAIRYGAAYLAAQLDRFDGRALAAMAAYNGGPGNAARWLEEAGGDDDLFLEIVDFRETRAYVRLTAEHRLRYRALYPDLAR